MLHAVIPAKTFYPPPTITDSHDKINQENAQLISENLDLTQLTKDSLKKTPATGIETEWTKNSDSSDSEYYAISTFTGEYLNNGIKIISGSIYFSFTTSRDNNKVILELFNAVTVEPIEIEINGKIINNISFDFSGVFDNAKIFEKSDGTFNTILITGNLGINSGTVFTVGESTVIANTNKWQGGIDLSWYNSESGKKEYSLSTADQLAGLRYLVNKGNDFSDIIINLANDIDLNSVKWTPIGTYTDAVENDESAVFASNESAYNGFKGTFNGNGYTIRNLSASGSTMYKYAIGGGFKGLFGILESGSTVKNLTIENVNIEANGMVGAIAGYIPSSSSMDNAKPVTFENINVIGDIKIKSLFNVGGIVGRSESGSSVHIANCKVSGNDGSYIKSYSSTTVAFAGGIIGAEYSSTDSLISNPVVENISINGYVRAAGGIAGHVLNTTISNPTLNNVKVSLDYFDEASPAEAKSIGAFTGTIGSDGQTSADLEAAGKMLIIGGTANISNVILSFPHKFSENNQPFCNGYVGAYRGNEIMDQNPESSIEGLPTSSDGISFEYAEN